MKQTPSPWPIVLVLMLVVTLAHLGGPPPPAWDERLVPVGRVRQRFNPRRNRERWARRLARWRRQRRQPRRAARRRRRQVRPAQRTGPAPKPRSKTGRPSGGSGQPSRRRAEAGVTGIGTVKDDPDPLAELRHRRGWVDQISEAEVWALIRQVRWPQGPVCPHCGESDPAYVRQFDPDYRHGLGRWRCRLCAEAGDPGAGGTFTPLTGTLLDGSRLAAPTLWVLVELFAEGKASVEAATEAGVNRHTSDRLFRLLRAAIYQTRALEPIALAPTDVVECDEVYLTAGLKGQAGGLALEREARSRGLKRRGRGPWDSDRLPIFGLLCRGGQVRLFVLRNVQTQTIQPIVEQMVQRGARVYTDGYSIYHFLSREGYQHQVVNHSAGQYAADLDGDGHCEVHCNTLECTWSWLRPMIRTYRGVSKVYLPLYVAQFEFLFNRRHHNRWNRTLDVLQALFAVEGPDAADLLASVSGAQFAEVCPVAG